MLHLGHSRLDLLVDRQSASSVYYRFLCRIEENQGEKPDRVEEQTDPLFLSLCLWGRQDKVWYYTSL